MGGIWNERLSGLINEKCGSQKSFAQAYKMKYGTGNQADVSRWVNVGTDGSKGEVIGFPSFDTMKRIADFFGVTVGYLTGETDYKTFDMERACEFFGIDEVAGKAIQHITKQIGATRFEKYEKENYGNVLCFLLSTENFEELIGGICEYAEAVYIQKNPVDYFSTDKVKRIRPEVFDIAMKHFDVCSEEELDDPSIITDEVLDAIQILSEAESKSFDETIRTERDIKLAKFELQERYFRLIDEVIKKADLGEMRTHHYERISSVSELKKIIEATIPEE